MKPDDKIAFIEPLLSNVWLCMIIFFFLNASQNQQRLHLPPSCRFNLLHLHGWSQLATIAVLMGLGHSFCLHPCSHCWFLLSVYPWITLEQAPWFYSFHALHSTGYKSLFQSSAIPPRVHISLCSVCAAPFATPALSVSACQSLICTSSICSHPPPPPPHYSFCWFLLCLLYFISLPSKSALLALHSFGPSPTIWFIAVACNSLPTYFSRLRCTLTPHSNII